MDGPLLVVEIPEGINALPINIITTANLNRNDDLKFIKMKLESFQHYSAHKKYCVTFI